jgi:hypothetical protein
MARPKNTDYLEKDIKRIRDARQFLRQEGYTDLWKRMVNLYRGKHYEKLSSEDRMLINLAFATKNVIAPSVAVNNPRFVINARKPESAPQAIITEVVLNYLWRTHKYQDEFRLAVDDFLVAGHGWIKCGYKATKPVQLKPLPDDVELGSDCEGVDDRDETVVGNVESEVRTFGDDDRPFAERVSIFDMFCDPDARHPKEMKWIAQRTRRPLADVLVDSRYDKKVREACTGISKNTRIDDEDRDIDGQPDATDEIYVDVWEFYDLRRQTVSTFTEQCEEGYLIAPQKQPYAFGHPFVMLRNYEVTDLFYPMGELEAMEELQLELNQTRSQMMNHRKKYQRKTLYDKEAFDQEGIDALRSDKDNTLVPVDTNAGVDITKVVAPMPQEHTPPDFYNQSELIASDIDRVTGVSDYMRGATQNIRRTATEAAMIQDAQNARAADKLARVESTLAQIGQRIVQLMQQYLTGEHVVRIVGMQSNPIWVKFDRDFIAGEFDFEVEAGSTQPRNESFRQQKALQLVDAMAPFVSLGVVNPQALAQHVLQFGFDVKDPASFIQAAPQIDPMTGQPIDPMAQQGMPPQGAPMPPQGGGAPMAEAPPAESPIPGIPPELVAQLMGSTGLSVSP